jgi:non-specific serine/threonine protein kinase
MEVQWPVAPLGLPDPDHIASTTDLQRVPAVDLFLGRAAAAGAALELTEQTAHDVAELCVRLDGLPLAIELAAARTRLLTPRTMLARLGQQIELLRSEDADRAPRHQSLRAAVGWSYSLLTPNEQRAFRGLSVFAGGCSLDAAESVLGGAGALDLVASLIDKSLVRNEPGLGGESRLRMLETIRAFGLEQLAASGEQDTLYASHASYFHTLLKPARWDALDLPTPDWLALVEAEHDNLRTALRWSLTGGDAHLALELATSIQGFWVAGGYLREGLDWTEQALSKAVGIDQRLEAQARHVAGQLAWRQGDYDRAWTHYMASVTLRRGAGDPFGVAVGLQGLASVARDRGDVHEAIVLWEECVAVFRASGNPVRVARATLNLAIALHLAAQSERAAGLLEEAAGLAHQVGQHWAEATALTYQALLALEVQHDTARAATQLRDALALAPRVRDAWVTAYLLELVAWVALDSRTGAHSAAQLFGAAEVLRERMGARLHPAFVDGHERYLARLWQADHAAVRDALSQGRASSTDAALLLAGGVVRAAQVPQSGPARAPAASAALSEREREVAGLVAQGLTSREIAERLVLGERTVETHVDHIRAKLGVRSRAQIATWAVERGLVVAPRR